MPGKLAPHARTEEDIFEYLGLVYVKPEDRNCEIQPLGSTAAALTCGGSNPPEAEQEEEARQQEEAKKQELKDNLASKEKEIHALNMQKMKELADMDLTANTDGGVLVHNPTTGKYVLQPYKFDGGDF